MAGDGVDGGGGEEREEGKALGWIWEAEESRVEGEKGGRKEEQPWQGVDEGGFGATFSPSSTCSAGRQGQREG